MFRGEKILNEVTLILTIITMISVFFLKYGIVSKTLVIFLCFLTLLVYLCSRTISDKNSKLNNEDKQKLESLKVDILKKGKEKDGKKDSSNSR